MAEEDRLSVLMGLELVTTSLAEFFSLRQKGMSEEDVYKEFAISPEKKPSLSQMIGDFTYYLLGDQNIKAWASKDNIQKISDSRKYALKLIGKRVKGNKVDLPEEQRSFDYIVSHLKHLKASRSKNEEERKVACGKLYEFFSNISKIVGSEASRL